MKKRFLPLSMVLITMLLAQAGLVSNAAENQGKYVPRTNAKATVSSYMKSIRANQETGLIDPALMLKAQKAAQTSKRGTGEWKVMGPDNYGALTRAMIYDQNDPTNNTLLIGTMGGHIFESVNGGITMRQAYDLNTMISCMIQVDGVTFVGTGDGRSQYMVNGLSHIGYETGFIGKGIYRIAKDGSITLLSSTTPTATNGWGFVNEMAVMNGNIILAATNGGVYKSSDMGDTWSLVVEGQASAVRANSKYVLAVVNEDVLLITADGGNLNVTSLTEAEKLPVKDGIKIVAAAQSDPEYLYAAYIKRNISSSNVISYTTDDIFYSKDGGNTWQTALAATGIYDIFGSNGYVDNAIEVFPNNPRKLLLGGSSSVWTLEDATNTGVYRPISVSVAGNELASIPFYVHIGIQNFLFNPDNANVFFVGTEGGVFKGLYSENTFTFTGCNRYFIRENEQGEAVHTSVARMFGVGIGGDDNRVLGGNLDHGTILIEGSEDINNVETGRAIFPNCDPNSNAAVVDGYGTFSTAYAGGHAEISTFNPDIIFVSATGSMATPLYRSETSGSDYDMENFYNADSTFSKVITNANAFRTPFAMFENYQDIYSLRTTYYAAPIAHEAGETVEVFSNLSKHPFYYTLEEDVEAGDTIWGIQDIISATMVCGIEGSIYMTRNSHYFNEMSRWWRIGKIEGIPTAVAISNDGDMTIVGTADGKLYRVSNLSMAVTPELADVDSLACIVNFEVLDTTTFKNRAVTAISIVDDNVLVSLGNYGNNDYVYLSTNDGDSFTSIQGSLPKAPVYSCLIESTKGDIFVGTEYGIYSKRNGGDWTAEGSVKVPVTELRQATVSNYEDKSVLIGFDNGDVNKPLYENFKGVTNHGVIYAATYGNGIIKCSDYKTTDLGIDENEIGAENALQMNVYPNPVRGTANINIELSETATVSYQVYDLSGRMVMSNVIGTFGQGENTVSFSTSDLTSGSYILHVQAGSKTCTSKILVF